MIDYDVIKNYSSEVAAIVAEQDPQTQYREVMRTIMKYDLVDSLEEIEQFSSVTGFRDYMEPYREQVLADNDFWVGYVSGAYNNSAEAMRQAGASEEEIETIVSSNPELELIRQVSLGNEPILLPKE